MITDVMLNKKQIDPNTFDINIVSQLADRTFYNRDQMPNEAYKLNLITAKRLLNKVNVKQAKEYILRLKILSSDSAISLQQKISTAILQQKLSLITLSGKTFEDSILESEKLDEVFDMINISDFASSYEEFYLDKLQLYFNCLPYYNEPNFKIKKQQHLNAIEKICSDSNPKLLTKDIEFASKFYYVETFSLDTNKKKDDLEKLKKAMDKKEFNSSPLFGRVINSLANSYNVLNIYGEKSKKMWMTRLEIVLKKNNIKSTYDSATALFSIISKNYNDLDFNSKTDVLYSTGSYSRYILTKEKNYPLALELSQVVKDLNLVAGNYLGYSTACNCISKCFNELYKSNKDKNLFDQACNFSEQVYYELENSYIGNDTKANPQDAVSQFIVLVNWIELLSMNSFDEKHKKSISNAVKDFIAIFSDNNSKIILPKLKYIEDYKNRFLKLMTTNKFIKIDPLTTLFDAIKV